MANNYEIIIDKLLINKCSFLPILEAPFIPPNGGNERRSFFSLERALVLIGTNISTKCNNLAITTISS